MVDDYDLPAGSERNRALHDEAQGVFPGGVSHNIRSFEPYPIYVERAADAIIEDADGNEYVDFWMNHITSLLGHAHPDVVDAVQEQAANGLHWGTVNEKALALGRKIQEYVPSAERVRFCASGTEATMYAVRLARAYTGHDHVLKLEGGWHGGNTDLSVGIHAPYDKPETVGLPPGAPEHVHAFPLNDRDAVERLLDAHDVAGIIIEPLLLAGGGVVPDESFLEYLRDAADEHEFVLIFDEVVTGFRFAPGSYQARVGVLPDITTLGKFVGGGLPVGALCGRADLFTAARPAYDGDDPVLAGGGTFSMNPMTATAGLASLDVLESEPVHDYVESQGERVREELAAVFADLGIDAAITGAGSLFLNHFEPDGPLETVADIETGTNRDALKTFHRRLFERGYYFLPGHMGAISYATTEEQLDGFLEAAEAVARELQADGVL
ncbi:MAG: aspartate aminotransferase family protein [Haloferacaceae archaeon]